MHRPVKESKVTGYMVELLMPGTELTVWSRADLISSLNFNDETDPDNRYPEGAITKQFWKELYWGIEQWRRTKEYR